MYCYGQAHIEDADQSVVSIYIEEADQSAGSIYVVFETCVTGREELERQLRELESRVLRRDARQGSREAPRRTPDAAAAKARHTSLSRAPHALMHVLI